MTVYEVIASYPAVKALGNTQILKACIDRDLDSSLTYTKDKQQVTDLVIADCLIAFINSPDFTEGDLSETYDRDKLEATANGIYDKYGVVNPSGATVRMRNIW